MASLPPIPAMADSSRLERALSLWLEHQANASAAAATALLAAHPDLADLLEPLLSPDGEPAPSATEPTQLADFELGRELGRGGMGIVYEARQRALGRRVAIKLLAPEYLADPARVARFRREATTLANLEHPHVVRVLAAGEEGGRHWLAMEFVDGGTLDERLQQLRGAGGHHGGSLRQVVTVVQQVGNALMHLHALGILHRDVKPANVLLTADGSPRLSDFGLARPAQAAALTRTGLLSGTPHYLAPDYVLSGEATAASDVWSLGATLYEAVTLQRPFAAAREELVLQRVLHAEPVDPRRLLPGLSEDLVAVMLRALEKEPANRYPDMATFAADLQAFLDLRPTSARPPSVTQRVRRWLQRERWRAGLLATALVAAGLLAFVLLRLDTLRAGERAANDAAFEGAMAEAFVRRHDGRRERAAAAAALARSLRPGAGEAIVVDVLQTMRFESPAAALARLEQLVEQPHDADAACQWLRVLLLGRLGRTVEEAALLERLGEPRSQLELLLAAGRLVDRRNVADDKRALELTSQATRIGPPRLLVHLQWATLVHNRGAPSQRSEAATVLLQLWPQHPQVLGMAAALVQPHDPARALALQRQALVNGLDDRFGALNLARYAASAGEVDAAIAAAREGLQAAPRLPDDLRAGLLQIVTELAPEQVPAVLQAALASDPEDSLALRDLAWWHYHEGDLLEAQQGFEHALRARPDDPRTLQGIALTLQDRGDLAGSTPFVDRLLAAAPASEGGHRLRVHLLRGTGADAAQLRGETARWAAAADAPGAWRQLAEEHLAAGDVPAALAALDRAEAKDGGERATLELRLRAHVQAGESASAGRIRERLRR
jgi:tetratricopeptide (TPR) repeat protein/predicted Ser/Thr protein kinase